MSDAIRQVIAMGDGGMDDKNPLLDLYIIAQSKKKLPKICFLPTASGDNPGMVKYFHHLFDRYPCDPSHLTLFRPHTADIESFIMAQDVIYVGGGQTKSMLAVWRDWGLDKILKKAYENGTIMSGGSAGSVCWFEQCITDSIPGSLTVMNCLGILPYSNCPHFDSDERRPAYRHYMAKGEIKAGYGNNNGAAVHFINENFHRALSAVTDSGIHKFSLENGRVEGKRIKTIFLGKKENQQKFIWDSEAFAYLKDFENESEPELESEPSLEGTDEPEDMKK